MTTPPIFPIAEPPGCATLSDVLALRAAERPGALAFRYLDDGEVTGPHTVWTYAELARRSERVAAALARVAQPGDRALLLFAPGLDFIAAFFGCIRAGVVAVPVPPPDPSRLEATLPRFFGIVADAAPACVLTTRLVEGLARGMGGPMDGAPWIAVDELDDGPAADAAVRPEDLAFLQYTSGSTGEPKGVRVSHRNLLANLRMAARGMGLDTPGRVSQGVSWLPFYHDMGLVGSVLLPVYLGSAATLLSPLDFLKRPARWLEAIAHFEMLTVSGGPDFAYALAARKTGAEIRARLDLSSWDRAACGAEPVRAETLDGFARTFAPCGFSPAAFCPGYGLAEATVFVSMARRPEGPGVAGVDGPSLERGEIRPGDRRLVRCGAPCLGGRVRIVAPGTTRPAADGQVGEILVAGPHVADGYWGKPGDPAFGVVLDDGDGPFLRTGDLGFLSDGGFGAEGAVRRPGAPNVELEIVVTGRLKDLIIVRGRNLHPSDLEDAAEGAHPALRPGGVAAFGVQRGGEERAAMICEVDARRGAIAEVPAAVRDAVGRAFGVDLDPVLLVPPRTILRTTSGKIQRGACRDLWVRGELPVLVEDRRPPPAAPPDAPARRGAAELVGWMERWIQENVRPGPVRPEDTFTAAGLDSLSLVQIAADLERTLGFEVPAELLFGGTIKSTAAVLAMGKRRLSPGKPRDFDAEAALPPALAPRAARSGRPEGHPAALLVTGATGFLGGHLVLALLRRTGAPILCLVRAPSDAAAMDRLVEAFARLGLGEVDASRVRAVAGDLSRPRFGLPEERFSELAAEVGAIYHAGAEVSWSKPYSSLKEVNVGGTLDVVRLACAAPAEIHYISTIAVFPIAEDTRPSFPEDEDLTDADKLQLGYQQSKWVAEKMLEHARDRGLRVTVYRPGFIAGHSRTGAEAASERHLFHAFLAGCVQMGEAPAVDKVVDVVPVDWVAEAVAALSLEPRALGRRFNLVNPSPLVQRRWYEIIRRRGFALREIAYARWREQVLALGRENPLARFSVYYRVMTEARMARLEVQMASRTPVDDGGARALLDAMDLRCPPFDERLAETYLGYYVRHGLLPEPAPAAGGAAAPPPRAAATLLVDASAKTQPRLWALYEKGKARQWNAASRIDWSLDLDPENPEEMPDVALPLYGSPIFQRMTRAEKAALRRHYQAWQMSQFQHGEQGALLCAAKIVQQAPTVEGRMFASTQVLDEARHLEVFTRLLSEKLELSYPVTPPLARLLDDVIGDRRWDVTCLGMQVLVEGLALAAFGSLRDQSKNPLVVRVNAFVMEDEARHVAFGRLLLEPYYAELSDAERAEREELVVEASYLLRDRFQATDVWAALGLPVGECTAWLRESGFQRAWRAELFSRIVPSIRAIGLWGARVQRAYAQMGVLNYADVDLDALMRRDEEAAGALEVTRAR